MAQSFFFVSQHNFFFIIATWQAYIYYCQVHFHQPNHIPLRSEDSRPNGKLNACALVEVWPWPACGWSARKRISNKVRMLGSCVVIINGKWKTSCLTKVAATTTEKVPFCCWLWNDSIFSTFSLVRFLHYVALQDKEEKTHTRWDEKKNPLTIFSTCFKTLCRCTTHFVHILFYFVFVFMVIFLAFCFLFILYLGEDSCWTYVGTCMDASPPFSGVQGMQTQG